MFSYRSYFSSYKLRFLLTAVLICCCSITRAQVDTTPFAEKASPEIVAPADQEDEEEGEEGTELTIEPSLRTVPDSSIKRFKAEKEFEYANDPAYWDQPLNKKKKKKPETPIEEVREPRRSMFDFSGLGGIANIILLLLVLALLGFLIYKLMGDRWPWERSARLKDEEEILNEEDLNVDELQLKIKEAIGAGKFRMAIRYSYLFTLRRLDEKQWIRLDAKSTNHDYVRQMKDRDPHGTFAYLTNVYDYVWYGEFELTEEQFNLVYKDFQKYLNTYSH